MEIESAVASLSALASILSIAVSVRGFSKKKNISNSDALADYARKASRQEKELLENNAIQKSIIQLCNMKVISDALLSQLESQARDCEDQHIEGLKNAKTENEQFKVHEQASRCMCSVLRAIKLHNKDMLPSDLFDDWWESYRCSD